MRCMGPMRARDPFPIPFREVKYLWLELWLRTVLVVEWDSGLPLACPRSSPHALCFPSAPIIFLHYSNVHLVMIQAWRLVALHLACISAPCSVYM